MDVGDAARLFVLIILILLSGFFSSAETAMTVCSRIRIRSMADAGDKRAARLLKVLDNGPKMLSTILIGNNIVNLSASSIATVFATDVFGSQAVGISTGGASPSAAIYLKDRINALLPERLDEILSFLEAARIDVKSAFPAEEDRSAVFKELFTLCMQRKAPLTAEGLRQFILERSKVYNG